MTSTHITLIGCGKMGAALLQGWLNTESLNAKYIVIEPSGLPEEFSGKDYVQHAKNTEALSDQIKLSDVLVIAVKPQVMSDVCQNLKDHVSDTALILSIAAGQTIANFESYFSKNQPLIRAMPNIPAAVGKGTFGAVANKNVTEEQRKLADTMMKASGHVEWVDDESLMDAVTAVSGSGPAYFFAFVEALTNAGIKAGLPPEQAKALAAQTLIGAGALLDSSEDDVTQLRINVTSPGGTTEAGLEILSKNNFEQIVQDAVIAAKDRAIELGKS